MAHTHDHPHDHGPDHDHNPVNPAYQRPSDPAHDSLASALRSSFNILRLIMVLLVVAYVWSGVFQVNPGEQGLIARLGRLRTGPNGSPVFQPDWYAALPDPFDEKIRLPGLVQELAVETFAFKPLDRDVGKPLAERSPTSDALKPGNDGAMITGDRNLSHGVWRVFYLIDRGDLFVTNVGDSPDAARPLLARMLENSVVRVAAGLRVEVVTRTAADVAALVKERLQAQLDRLETGITVSEVRAETVEPAQVRDAFNRVTIAQNEKLSAIQKAEQRRNEILNKAAGPTYVSLLKLIDEMGAAAVAGASAATAAGADPAADRDLAARIAAMRGRINAELDNAGGQVSQLLNEARADASHARGSIEREFEEFKYLLPLYRAKPDLVISRLWTEMRVRVQASKFNETFFLPRTRDIEIITNRDPNRQKAIDVEQYRRQSAPGGGADSGPDGPPR